MASQLRSLLGSRLTAYLGGVQETRAVNQWADGDKKNGVKPQSLLLRAKALIEAVGSGCRAIDKAVHETFVAYPLEMRLPA